MFPWSNLWLELGKNITPCMHARIHTCTYACSLSLTWWSDCKNDYSFGILRLSAFFCYQLRAIGTKFKVCRVKNVGGSDFNKCMCDRSLKNCHFHQFLFLTTSAVFALKDKLLTLSQNESSFENRSKIHSFWATKMVLIYFWDSTKFLIQWC